MVKKLKGNLMKTLHTLTYILMFFGALNIGIFGLYHLDVIAILFGASELLVRIIYVIIGSAAIINILLGISTIHCDIRHESTSPYM
jgi:uncharacterized protein